MPEQRTMDSLIEEYNRCILEIEEQKKIKEQSEKHIHSAEQNISALQKEIDERIDALRGKAPWRSPWAEEARRRVERGE